MFRHNRTIAPTQAGVIHPSYPLDVFLRSGAGPAAMTLPQVRGLAAAGIVASRSEALELRPQLGPHSDSFPPCAAL